MILKQKWRLDSLLGVGGMAAVYGATHRNGNRVAIKVLHPEAALIPHVQTRFLREGYLANRVNHPGAVSVLDDEVDEQGLTFLVLELLDGASLEAVHDRHRGRLEPREVLAITHEILGVLAAAHDRDIIHRDLKPANIFIERSGTLRVLDFGIARLLDPQSGPGETAGQPIGTPGFMPPEQARGRSDEVGRETDVWAVGATMFYLLTGRAVHEAETVAEQLVAAITQPAPPIRSIAPDVPDAVAEIVDRALAYEPARRFPEVRAMQQEIARAYGQVVGTTVTGAEVRAVLSHLPSPSMLPTAPTLVATPVRGSLPTAPGAARTRPARARRRRGGSVIAIVVAVGALGALFARLHGQRSDAGELGATLAAGDSAASAPSSPARGAEAATAPSLAVVPEFASAAAAASAPPTATGAESEAAGGTRAGGAAPRALAPHPTRPRPNARPARPPPRPNEVGTAAAATLAPPTPSQKPVDLFGRRE